MLEVEPMRAPRRVRPILVGVALSAPLAGGAAVSACSSGHALDVVLKDVDGERAKAAFLEVMVLDGGKCPAMDAVARGDVGATKFRKTVAASSEPPKIPDLDTGSYAFAARLVDGASCAAIAAGCTEADLGSVAKVVIPVGAVVPALGGCTAGQACTDGRCEASDGGGGGAGGGLPEAGPGACSLSLVASGALPALDEPGGTVAGPAIVATKDGFAIAYREGSIDASGAKAVLVTLQDDGTLGTASKQPIPTCAGFVADDGVGLALSSSSGGIAAASRPACNGGGAGLSILPFDASFALGAAVSTPDLATNVRLAASHALARGPKGYEVAVVAQGKAQIGSVDESGALATAPLFPSGSSSYAELAIEGDTLAAIADRISGGAAETEMPIGPVPAPGGGGGTGGGGAGGGGGVGGAGAGAGGAGASGLSVHRALSPWAALTAWSVDGVVRVGAISLDPSGTTTWGVVDRSGVSHGTGSLGQADAGTVTAGDLAVLGDHAIIAVARPRGFHVWQLRGATATSLAQDGFGVDESNTIGDQNLGNYDGARISVAAARQRIAVVWVTRKQLGTQDATGGFALYACEP